MDKVRLFLSSFNKKGHWTLSRLHSAMLGATSCRHVHHSKCDVKLTLDNHSQCDGEKLQSMICLVHNCPVMWSMTLENFEV